MIAREIRDQLEPGAQEAPRADVAALSIALSLKRIADAIDRLATTVEEDEQMQRLPMTAARP